MISPLLELSGAVPPPDPTVDPGVAWHHGDPLREQRVAECDVVVVDRSHREVIAVPGEDRLSWLHTITSQHLTGLGEGEHTEALVLDGQGRVEHHAVVSHSGGTVWLDTEPGQSTGLLRYLQQMVFWSKVEPRDATSEIAVLTLLGPSTGRLLMDFSGAIHGDIEGDVDGALDGGVVRAFDDRADLLVPRARLVQVWQRLISAGATPGGTWAYEALRTAALRPRLGVDTDDRTIPHEVGWIGPAVHLDKGCYRGQETVARVANLGRAPRRMVLLHLESGDTLPLTGSEIRTGGGDQTQRVVGRVGTVVTHYELGPIALALVKRSVEPTTPLLAGDVAASIDPDSVPPDSGEPPGRAALRRLRA